MQKYLSHFESALYWLILILIIFIPLYMKFPLFSVSGTFVSIRLEDILIALTYLVWIAYIIASGKIKDIITDKLSIAIITFFLIGFVSTLSAVFLTGLVPLRLGLFHLLRRIELIMLLPLVIWTIKSKKQVYFYLKTFFIVTVIVNLYALGQKFLGFPAISTINSELSKGLIYYLGEADRIVSTFAGHYDLAIYLVMFITLVLPFIFFVAQTKKIKVNKYKYLLLLGVTALISLITLVMTAARLSFIAVIMGVGVGLLLLRKFRFILLFLLILVLFSLYPSQLRDRFISTFRINIQRSWSGYFAVSKEQEARSKLNIPTLPATGKMIDTVGADAADIAPGEPVDITDLGVYRSFAIRINEEWPRALRAFRKNPLLGTGYSSIGLATDNDILRSLGEVGLLGTIAFLLIIYEVVKRIWFNYQKKSGFIKYFSAGCLALVFAFIVNSMFIDVFEASKVASLFWIILGINLGYSKLNAK